MHHLTHATINSMLIVLCGFVDAGQNEVKTEEKVGGNNGEKILVYLRNE